MPPAIVVGVAVLVGSVAAVASWLGLRPARQVVVGEQPVPADVVAAVLHLRAKQASAAELRSASAQAARYGHHSLAAALRDEAAALALVESSSGVQLDALYPSPLRQVGAEAWTQYVRRSRVARPAAVSPDQRFGCFALTMRELADAGWALDPRKGQCDGRTCWLGVWAPGRSEAEFLADAGEQREALETLTKAHARVIVERYRDLIGQELEGKPATLSGLLGVARRAGLGGLRGWATDAGQRRKFPETTAAYARLNGIF